MSEVKPFSGVDDRVRLADVVPLPAPFTLNLFPSDVCNFRCSYCAQSLGREYLRQNYKMNGEMMSIDTLQKVVEQSKAFPRSYKLVSFMGHGEPLCNRKLPQMIRLVKEAGIAERVDVITNASLLTADYAQELVEAGLDVMRVSLQGITSEAYQRTSDVRLDFETLLSQLKYYYKIKGNAKLFVKTMDVSLSDGEEELFYQMFADCTDRMYIDKVKPVYDGVEYAEGARDLSNDRYGNQHTSRVVCAQPFYMMSVWPNGDVAPCDAIYKASPLGNIHTDTLLHMWNSDALLEFRREQLAGSRYSRPDCKPCCAPDDVQHESDCLDGDRAVILERLNRE